MILTLDFWLMVLLVATAIVALELNDLLASVAVLGGYSFFVAVLFAHIGAIDVAFMEAVLGAGAAGVLFVVTLFCTRGRFSR